MIDFEIFLTTQDEKLKAEFIKKISLAPQEYLDRLCLPNKNCAQALAILTKKSSVVKALGEKFENVLMEYFCSQDAKIRKYAYVIAGNYNNSLAKQLLSRSVDTESTFYTLPSLMLALGTQKDRAKDLLARVESLKEQIAPKIYAEIVSAYNKVCPAQVYDCDKIDFEKEDFLITTQKCYEDILCAELAFKKQKSKRGIICKNLDLTGFRLLCNRRDIYEVFLLVGTFDNVELASKSAMEKLNALTKNCNHPIGYRVNCNDNKLKAKFIELCSLSGFSGLINSPSNYSVTLDFFVDGLVVSQIKFEKFKPDFSYRTEFLPASINPVTASIISKIAQKYNPNAKIVCDTFCGTATMLVERFFTNQNLQLYGSDISADAIKKAKTNLQNALIKATLAVKNITEFKTPCDEIISNLPYGLRVGSHQGNFEIYKALIFACEKYLSSGGYAFLYTADKKLLRDLIKRSKLNLVDELSLTSGGLFCSLFIIKK